MTAARPRLLVAGLTGQLGHGLVLASRETDVELVPVVRPVGRHDPASRIARLFPGEQGLAERTVSGDVTQPHWAIEDTELAELAGSVEIVLNLASETNWSATKRALHASCVLGALHGLDIAALLAQPGDTRTPLYCWTSSLYTAGTLRGLIAEGPFPPGPSRTAYEHAKWLGEHALLRAAPASAIPILIARVGGLIGDSRTGATAKRNGLYRLREAWERSPGGVIPLNANGRIDTLPRDIAATTLLRTLLAATDSAQVGSGAAHIVHVCAGESAPNSGMLINALRAAALAGGQRKPQPLQLPEAPLTWLSENLDRLTPLSIHAHNSVVGLRYLAIDRVFDRANLAALIGSELPMVSVDLIARVLLGRDVRRVTLRCGDPQLARFIAA
jgi:nucleoside-diphosphate-sugar epimerase